MNPFNPTNPLNPVGLLNPISPLYIGRDDTEHTTAALLPPPPEREHREFGVSDGIVFGMTILLAALLGLLVVTAIRDLR